MKLAVILCTLITALYSGANAFAIDSSAPTITQVQPSANNSVTVEGATTFSGSVNDSGGAGIDKVFFVIKNLATGAWVDVDGTVDEVRVFRDAQLSLSDPNTAEWRVDTALPAGNYRLYVAARDGERNTVGWGVRTNVNNISDSRPPAADTTQPVATLAQPTGDSTSAQQFRGGAQDTGGSGLKDVFFLIRDITTRDFVSPSGAVEEPRRVRLARLELDNDNTGRWSFNTRLPNGRYRFYVGVSDNADNINYWVVRTTVDIVGNNDEPPPDDGESIFVPTSTDITDPFDFYQRDGYETIDVIRMDVITRTNPGVCNVDDESGCTLADVLADVDGDDDFKVDIDVTLNTNGVVDTGNLPNARLRQRGASSRQAPQKSFRIRLDDDLWRNEERLQLNKHPFDQSRMTNKLAFDLMQRLPHLPSLRTQFVNLWIDDGLGPVDQGLYTHVESRAKEYLINRGLDKDDNVYKANFFTFSESDLAAIQVDEDGEPLDEDRFEARIEIDRGDDHTKLVEMVAAINDPNISFEAVLDRYFNRNNVLMWVTANLLLGQDDVADQNFFLYNPKGTETFYFLPWDYDGSLRVEPPLTNDNSFDELRRRLLFGFANAANNNFLRQFYLLPQAHNRIVRAATEVRRDYFTDDLIRDLSSQYANVIRPFISRSPDIENIGGVRRLERLNVWEERWQSFPDVVASNLEKIKASPNMPLPHKLKLPFARGTDTVLWWERATDITGGTVTYDLAISSRPDFAPGSIIYEQQDIPNQPQRVELVLDRQSLPAGTWFYRVFANAGEFSQAANIQIVEGGERYVGIRKFVVE